MAAAHQGTAPEVGEVASQVTTNPSEAGTSSSSVWCAARGLQSLQNLQRLVSPDIARAVAQEKARKLEKALEVMTDVEGPAVDALRAELKKVQGAAAVPVLDVQIEQCESFIALSQRWLTELEKQRGTEEEFLFEAKARLESLRAQAEQVRVAPSAATNAESELARLRGQVVELQRTKQGVGCVKRRPPSEETPFEGRFRAHMRRSPPHCRQSRYGLRRVRIGEASNPGPLSSDDVGDSHPEEEFLDQFQRDLMSGRRRRVRRRVVDTNSDTPMEDARTDGGNRRPSRRVVLVPGSEDGTPQSIQDRVPSTVSGSGCEIPTTVPASSGTVRKLVGVQSRPPTEFISSDEEPVAHLDLHPPSEDCTCSLAPRSPLGTLACCPTCRVTKMEAHLF